MITPLTIVLLGFFLGMRHALDPDHVVAVSTIISREQSVGRAARIGVLWGIGHSVTIVVIGGAITLFRVVLPPRAGMVMELAVAAMLIVLGVVNLKALFDSRHVHPHGEYIHHHGPHHHHRDDATPLARLDGRLGASDLYRTLRPLAVGVVHGLAGSAAVALLIVPAIRAQWLAMIYLAVFGSGTIGGMMLMTSALAAPMLFVSSRIPSMQRHIALAVAVCSIAFGTFLAYRIGVPLPQYPRTASASVAAPSK